MPLWLAARRAASAARPAVQFTLCLPTATALNRELRRTDVVPHRFLLATLAEARAPSPTGWRRRHGYKPTCPRAWGAVPTRGGKIAWAIVRPRSGD
jgi:hypothetical protein